MYELSGILVLVMLIILLITVIIIMIKCVLDIITFEKNSDEEWCYLFDYVIDIKIKNKKFMDFVVLTLIQDVFDFKNEDIFTILDKNGKRCLMLCEPIEESDNDTVLMITNNDLLASSNFIKQVLLHKKSDGNKDKQFLIRVIAKSATEVL